MADLEYPMVVGPLMEEDGGGYIAFAPDLPHCVGDGDSAENALADLRNAIKEWIAEARELKRGIPAPGSCAARVRAERKGVLKLLKAQDDLVEAQREALKLAQNEVTEIRERLEKMSQEHESGHHMIWGRQTALMFANVAEVAKRDRAGRSH